MKKTFCWYRDRWGGGWNWTGGIWINIGRTWFYWGSREIKSRLDRASAAPNRPERNAGLHFSPGLQLISRDDGGKENGESRFSSVLYALNGNSARSATDRWSSRRAKTNLYPSSNVGIVRRLIKIPLFTDFPKITASIS